MSQKPPPQIMQRNEAIYLRRKTFYTGRPCKHGHLSSRYTSNGGCLDCMHPKMWWPTDDGEPLQVLLRVPRGASLEYRTALTKRIQEAIPFFTAMLVQETGMPDPYKAEELWKATRARQIQALRASVMPDQDAPQTVPGNLTTPSD